MIRYCLTERAKLVPCDTGSGSVGSEGFHSCWDEPQEKNCHMLVDENTRQTCPSCGNYMGKEVSNDTGN